jgi:hypothetical protein
LAARIARCRRDVGDSPWRPHDIEPAIPRATRGLHSPYVRCIDDEDRPGSSSRRRGGDWAAPYFAAEAAVAAGLGPAFFTYMSNQRTIS